MSKLLHHNFDAEYGLLPDAQIEVMWRHAVLHDPDAREPLLRQLVLRAATVIDDTVRRQGAAHDFNPTDHKNAFDETAHRLMSRLRVDTKVNDIRALAHDLACEVVNDPERRRAPFPLRFASPPRAELRLVPKEESR
jgi:hypothetical protein